MKAKFAVHLIVALAGVCAEAKNTEEPTLIRQLITFAGSPNDYGSPDDLDAFSATSQVQGLVAIVQEDLALCYEPGKKKEAMLFLGSTPRLPRIASVTENGSDIVVNLEINYSYTEFGYEKTISECSMDWIRKQYQPKN